MGESSNWLVTVVDAKYHRLFKCALKVSNSDISDDCVLHYNEPENRKIIHSLLPDHIKQIGPIVEIESIFDVKIIKMSID